jgi:hypothetical protein
MVKSGASEERAPTPNRPDRTNERQGRSEAEAKGKQGEDVGGDISRYTQNGQGPPPRGGSIVPSP